MMCVNKNCENHKPSAEKHQYCTSCVKLANEVMSNARCVKTGNKPDFVQSLRIGEHALRIYQNAYASPEQLEWATMIYPSGWLECFEPTPERNNKSE